MVLTWVVEEIGRIDAMGDTVPAERTCKVWFELPPEATLEPNWVRRAICKTLFNAGLRDSQGLGID